ncbi:pyrroloquinoline quinone biosynthesis protein PqqF [Paramixta manurensis]|uniref:Coenzyme PQQ synthesis protein F n=1 Tax=Paramixta manurensis TaxID=2740817 RepID=A0A6M8UC32_9GAMM|nr:pyrroloquinoline quinone biosynthesis protein PqqF [Erwiniaceae bacterium PD-1]
MCDAADEAQLTLANGLRVHLHHQPHAPRGAALVQIDAGSHHEPEAWPGLAHLLEHMVFNGSAAFTHHARLMAWVQAEGGRVNATTQAASTAFFFEVSADKLADGVARLVDMLAAPLLTEEALRHEVTVIDAEYQLLKNHAETRCDAATDYAFGALPAMRRFHVGNQASFGDDIPALRQALWHYHQRFYHAGNMVLWLQGPQSCAELAALAQQFGSAFAASAPPAAPFALPGPINLPYGFALACAEGAACLRLSFWLREWNARDAEALMLLQQLALDESQNSLLAALRAAELCEEIRLLNPYRTAQAAIVTLEFSLTSPDYAVARTTEAWFLHWLAMLPALSSARLLHYASLARRAFWRLPPLEQLRQRAMGFPPPAKADDILLSWSHLLPQLTERQMTRLWSAEQAATQEVETQGFRLPMRVLEETPASLPVPVPTLGFFTPGRALTPPTLPDASVPLTAIEVPGDQPVLLLRPAFGAMVSDAQGYLMQTALRSVAGDILHRGGQLLMAEHQGVWYFQIRGEAALLPVALAAAIESLTALSGAVYAQGERAWRRAQRADVSIRALLSLLPRVLRNETHDGPPLDALPQRGWEACLAGGDDALRQQLAHLLSRFPGQINQPQATTAIPPPAGQQHLLPAVEGDAALLLFCPLVENTAACLAAWRLLALVYEPLFFQRLREQQQVGYVVSCRFHQSADRAGILFALQSPRYGIEALLAFIERFLAEVTHDLERLSEAAWEQKRTTLRNALRATAADSLTRAREYWQRMRHDTPSISEVQLAQCDRAQLLHYHQRLREQPECRVQLASAPGFLP